MKFLFRKLHLSVRSASIFLKFALSSIIVNNDILTGNIPLKPIVLLRNLLNILFEKNRSQYVRALASTYFMAFVFPNLY